LRPIIPGYVLIFAQSIAGPTRTVVLSSVMNEADVIRENRNRLKERYGSQYDEILSILFRHDPIGINFETNVDEYEPEVDTILPRLKEARSPDELRRIIHEEFLHWFNGEDTAGPETNYDKIAREVWAAYQRHSQG
jgi:hypothetical protein